LTKQGSTNSQATPARAGAPVIVTQKMVEAGVFEAREHMLGLPLEELVTNIYIAMVLEAD
jgi:hypothetical protein